MTKPIRLDLAATARRIAGAKRLLLTTHMRADGDAIGSLAALRRVLRAQGHQVEALLHEPISPRYAFLTADDPLGAWEDRTRLDRLANADLIVIVDTCAANQLGAVAEAIGRAGRPSLAIDHHVTCDAIVDEAFSDPSAGACAQIIARLCDEAGWKIDRQSAALLYVGLATDTGWFRFSNADREVYDTAARLIDAGARPNVLYETLYLNDPAPRARLIGYVLTTFELHADGRLAVIRLPRSALAQCGATDSMTEDLINEPQRVGAVTACVLIAEPPKDGPIRVSFRSKRDLDVAALAARWGGGGHERAAGAKVAGTIESVAAQVIPAMVTAMEGRP